MKFTELKDDLKNGRRAVYLFEGDDAYFRSSAEAMVKKAFLEMPELNYISFDGEWLKGAALEEITSALAVFPFMAPCRIVRVTELYPTDADYEKYLKSTFENFPDTATLIIVNSQSKKGCDLKRKKCVSYFDCNKADRETVARWAYLTMKKAGVSSSVEACEAIADYCVTDMARVSREVEKLIEWGKDGLITKADVDELVYKDADYRIYQMTGAVSRGDYAAFTEICRDLLSKGYDSNAV
ncbi:MAG: DNA polymerase III subunit delta, partial [Candidatus Coproplasma sp.]